MSERLKNIIDGEALEVEEDGTTIVVDPATERPIATVPHATERVVGRAVAAADRAYDDWARVTPKRRSDALLRLAQVLEDHGDEVARLEASNVGMPLSYAEQEVAAAADSLRFFAGAARTMTGISAGEYAEGMTSFVRRDPLGVVASMLPWNVPVLMAAWKVGPALAGGNSLILKPSLLAPLAAIRLGELWCGELPSGLLSVVTGSDDVVGQSLLDSAAVRMVTLTGTTEAGRVIASKAAATVKRLHLELGGKAPILVFPDADLAAAAMGIARGALNNSGQDCTAASRVIAHESVRAELQQRLHEAIAQVRVGDPFDARTVMGPLISRDRVEAMDTVLGQAESEGGRVHRGGQELPDVGFFAAPAMIADLEPSSPLLTREMFGPVLTVEPFRDQSVLFADLAAAEGGLGAGVWTRSLDVAMDAARRLQVGKIWINTHHRDALELPHGGVKQSGYGVDQSIGAMDCFTAMKSVNIYAEGPAS